MLCLQLYKVELRSRIIDQTILHGNQHYGRNAKIFIYPVQKQQATMMSLVNHISRILTDACDFYLGDRDYSYALVMYVDDISFLARS
jgi:hypothetical protein